MEGDMGRQVSEYSGSGFALSNCRLSKQITPMVLARGDVIRTLRTEKPVIRVVFEIMRVQRTGGCIFLVWV
jgi:hypothetical protein